MTATPDAPAFTPFVADMITAMMSQTHATTDQVIACLTGQVADQNAEIDAIRDRVQALFEAPYMPTPAAVIGALWPSAAVIDRYREGES